MQTESPLTHHVGCPPPSLASQSRAIQKTRERPAARLQVWPARCDPGVGRALARDADASAACARDADRAAAERADHGTDRRAVGSTPQERGPALSIERGTVLRRARAW